MSDYWLITRQGAVAVLTFTRLPDNSLSFLALAELDVALGRIAQDAGISVVVLTGGIPGYFVAHADLDDVGRMARGEPPLGDPDIYRRALARLETMPAISGRGHQRTGLGWWL